MRFRWPRPARGPSRAGRFSLSQLQPFRQNLRDIINSYKISQFAPPEPITVHETLPPPPEPVKITPVAVNIFDDEPVPVVLPDQKAPTDSILLAQELLSSSFSHWLGSVSFLAANVPETSIKRQREI